MSVTKIQMNASGDFIEDDVRIALNARPTQPIGITYEDVNATNESFKRASARIGRGNTELTRRTDAMQRKVAEHDAAQTEANRYAELAQKAHEAGDATSVDGYQKAQANQQRIADLHMDGILSQAELYTKQASRVDDAAAHADSPLTPSGRAQLQREFAKQEAEGVFNGADEFKHRS
ncbi:MAG TPA: hypothetical protein PKK10_11650 [Woeseiaceae bacterium]|nr:hypothetical protein [Woeseiaceae bacterium]